MNLRGILTNPAYFRWEICDRCRGNGTIVNPSVDGHGISREEFDEDPDFREAYFAGLYDITCPDCESGKVRVPEMSRIPFSIKRELAAERREEQWRREWAWEQERESRMLGEY